MRMTSATATLFAPDVVRTELDVRTRAAPAIVDAARVSEVLRKFGHSSFRAGQREVVESLVAGEDALVVMPTGAGKSLCYQVPAVLRAGCGVVVSPLIALMEDQLAKLRAQGFAAERIHSGRPREESREACRAYLSGTLDFLFFAPERLAVPGFPELLKKRTPALIAVDEAHCISHWGHDFRPEYRMLGERLLSLCNCPVVALTATATSKVQDDIVAQLRLPDCTRFVRGFRRTNIALEVVEAKHNERRELVAKLLADDSARPAIVYAPSRKEAEEVAEEFAAEGLAIAAYHAGMSPAKRESVQRAFSNGAVDVIVATVAFGMGVDKADVRSVIHLALAGSVEAYSQEVGRAGRDGLPSRAVMLCSFADRHTHEFFLEKSYPDVKKLLRVFSALNDTPQDGADLRRYSGLKEEDFAASLEKLWVHGGAIVDADQRIARGTDAWRATYEEQRRHKELQLDLMARFAEGGQCRVLSLLEHFGADDGQGACGICDACSPQTARLGRTRPATLDESAHLQTILDRLAKAPADGLGTGKLFSQTLEPHGFERRTFEALLKSLERAGAVRLQSDSFMKGNEQIRYTRARLLKRSIDGTVVALPAANTATTKNRARKTKVKAQVAAMAAPDAMHVQRLRAWRLVRARQEAKPAFRVLTDAVMMKIAVAKPQNQTDLASISGVGAHFCKFYGTEVLAIFDTTQDVSL